MCGTDEQDCDEKLMGECDAFKWEEVDEKLRKQIEEENGIFTSIKEISSWMIDEERGIVVWMQPSTKKR